MKIVTVVGARPQFIKAAAMSRVLRAEHDEILVHTGQHYDPQMSDVFFSELHIPKPDYDLGISGGTHAQMTARMLTALEEVLLKETPDALLVYGDTNSTLAAALAAVKLHIPVLHVEAGNRLGSLANPEEINRVLTDHMASMLFACAPSAMQSLRLENLADRAWLVGDPMYDAFNYYRQFNGGRVPDTLPSLSGSPVAVPEHFYYLTCHREENTRDDAALSEILLAMESLPFPTLYPVHPRNHVAAERLRDRLGLTRVRLLAPLGYLESVALVAGAERVVTDSGGVQREAFFAKVPCVTIFNYAVWPETMVNRCNVLAKPEQADIAQKLTVTPVWPTEANPFGDGHACEKIVALLAGGVRQA
ncbi:MAG TPA: UDP-N-acetylglucosamine 2-epimerase (non-hydrolyzing) [Candidatus Limiplasma sp.]|nr:UDP-N-acetylglucosamine 2-epimerase (non-hydrolyzing) [Candidatus Limiplasma sp.]HPS81224.1 UDP-N-acetylglucosamine 2-epimerase (non-hydrolyzing) [Candidatus Limiplasma sp.]